VRSRIVLVLVAAFAVRADVRDCVCDLANPRIAETRTCSLCLEAEKHAASESAFVLKDNNPNKPNRWLALPRRHYDGSNPLAKMSAADRLVMWNVAIAKGGDIARRQCYEHVHIGKLLDGNETGKAIYVDGPSELPVIADGAGRLHVHTGEQINETVLMR
jgi:hypothetical protein